MRIRPWSGVTRWSERDRRTADAQPETIRDSRDIRAQAAQRSAGLDSLDEFYDAYAAPAYGLALRVLHGDQRTAEDIVVETFVAVWQSQPAAAEGETADLERVLRRKVRERCLDVLRGRQDAVCTTGARALSARCTTLVQRDLATPTSAAIREQLAALSLDQREVIERAFYQGQRSEQIAEEIGISKEAVHQAMRRGLRTLVDRLSYARPPTILAASSGVRKRSSR